MKSDLVKVIKAINAKTQWGGRLLLSGVSEALASELVKQQRELNGYEINVVKSATESGDAQRQRNHGSVETLFVYCGNLAVPAEITTTTERIELPKATLKRLEQSLS